MLINAFLVLAHALIIGTNTYVGISALPNSVCHMMLLLATIAHGRPCICALLTL